MRKLGLIAGGGPLPAGLAAACRAAGRPYFVIRLRGIAESAMEAHPGAEVGLAELGKCFKTLKTAGCGAVCLAGVVKRPDFSALAPDFRGMTALPGVIAAARQGDDALLRHLLGEFEKEGFVIEGAHEVAAALTLPLGLLGKTAPNDSHRLDIERALTAARELGRLDIGQGAVVCEGLVLAVEAQEGTDAMLRRVAELPSAVRGAPERRRGVLAKAPKPIQELKVDMPVIGVGTVQRAAQAGLAGIVGVAGQLLVLQRDEAAALADEMGLFILGVEHKSP
jgi:DUF1009 family protein